MKGLKAYIISTGTLTNDINLWKGQSVLATRQNPDQKCEWVTVPTSAILIDHPTEGYILYDLGLPPDAEDQWTEAQCSTSLYNHEEGETLVDGLAKIGVTPEDINKVILSHLHNDHIGNIELFKHAEFWVSRDEAEYAFTLVNGDSDPSTHGFYLKKDVMMPVKVRHYVDEDTELFPGVDIMMLPGHSPGVMALVLHLESGVVIAPSDACNSEQHYNGGMPGPHYDSIAYWQSIKKLHDFCEENDATIWFSHDPDRFKEMKLIPEYYE